MFEKLKTGVQRGAIGAGLLALTASAHAELPTAVTGAFTTVQADAGDMLDAGWPLLVAITVGFVLMKLFRKVVSKAS